MVLPEHELQAIRDELSSCKNPYGNGTAGLKIAKVLADIPIDARLLQKKIAY